MHVPQDDVRQRIHILAARQHAQHLKVFDPWEADSEEGAHSRFALWRASEGVEEEESELERAPLVLLCGDAAQGRSGKSIFAHLVFVYAFNLTPDEFEKGLGADDCEADRKSTRLNSSHYCASRMPSYARKKK